MEESNEIMADHRPNIKMEDGILMTLNDDCFLEIFKHLALIDLANFKEAYGSLGAVADIGFRRKTRGSLSFNSFDTIDEALQITKQFGSTFVDLSIGCKNLCRMKWREIFSVIGEHCTEKLKALCLNGQSVYVRKIDILLISDILKHIETIEIRASYNTCPGGWFSILLYCKNVRSIKLHSAVNISAKRHKETFRNIKNLQTLIVVAYMNDTDLNQLVDNLMNNRLENLSLGVLQSIYTDGNFSELIRLKHLKRLSILTRDVDLNSFLLKVDSFNSLQVLTLRDTTIDETCIATLGRVTRLKVIYLLFCTLRTISHMESLLVLCGNKNLERIRLMIKGLDFRTVDSGNFMKIIEKRKAPAEAETCLYLTLPSLTYTSSLKAIPAELLEANRETVKLLHPNMDVDELCYLY